MRTFEKVTAHDSTAAIDHSWDNTNNSGVAWYVFDPTVGGVASLGIVHNDGTIKLVESDTIAANAPTQLVYDFPISKAVFRWVPASVTASTLTSRLTPKPSR